MRYQDIHLSDQVLYTQFLEYVRLGNIASALQILSNNPQLDTKKMVSEVFNDLTERLHGFEDAYYTEVEDVLAQHLVDLQQTVDDFGYKGLWDASTEYVERNMVKHNNELYYCLQAPPVGTEPSQTGAATTYWMWLGLRGETGQDSLANMNFKGPYSSTEAYETYDVVFDGSIFYYAKQASTGQPLTEEDYWGVLFTALSQDIVTAEVAPYDLVSGDFWLQIQT